MMIPIIDEAIPDPPPPPTHPPTHTTHNTPTKQAHFPPRAKMGKKKSGKREEAPDIWCFYCDRAFDDEANLLLHQKNKHFKCNLCPRKLTSTGGMVIHVRQVHKEELTKVPGAKEGRDSVQFEVFGMTGIPLEFQMERAAKKQQKAGGGAGGT